VDTLLGGLPDVSHYSNHIDVAHCSSCSPNVIEFMQVDRDCIEGYIKPNLILDLELLPLREYIPILIHISQDWARNQGN
jgi:hypothetical protein